MKWTSTNPDKEGHYWYRDNFCEVPMILNVCHSEGQLWADGEDVSFYFIPGSDADEGTFWSDSPIPEPI